MKSINTFILFSILLASSLFFSQSVFAQSNIKIGATAGVNFSTITKDGEVTDGQTGFRGGAVVDFGLSRHFSIVPELLFSQKGWKINGTGFTQKATVNYIELPINLVIKFNVASETKLTIFPGFYAAYAISGTYKNNEESDKITFGSGVEDLNPIDMGFNLGCGIEVKSVFFRFILHGGLKNLSNDPNYKADFNTVSLSLGYYFN